MTSSSLRSIGARGARARLATSLRFRANLANLIASMQKVPDHSGAKGDA
jgi:hypothetical protein